MSLRELLADRLRRHIHSERYARLPNVTGEHANERRANARPTTGETTMMNRRSRNGILSVLVAGLAVVAAACGGGGESASPREPARPYDAPAEPTETASGYLASIERTGTVLLDAAEVLSGPEAIEAARRVGAIGPDEELETDFFVLDADHVVRELQVTARTAVRLYDCTGPCELRDVAPGDFLSGAVRPYGGDRAIYSVELAGLEVVSLVEQYLP